MMNILILTAKYGMGHYTVSMSLKQQLENENTKIEIVDFYDIIFPKIKTIIYGSFNFLVNKCSRIYNSLYEISANTNFAPFNKIIEKRIDKLFEKTRPDIIISTFPICSNYMSKYKKQKNINIKLYTYITDVKVNKEWISNGIDAYFVASYKTKKQLIDFNIPKDKVKVVGIPIRKEFKENYIPKSKNEIVIMGGGLGLIPNIDNILEDLIEYKNIHITLLTGKNKNLFNKYKDKYENMDVIGYTDKVYKYIKRAELIISKAGGITLFETIYSKTPIFVLPPFLSQEIGNAKYIEENEIGEVCWEKNKEIANDIIKLLENQRKLVTMRNNMEIIKNDLENLNVLDIYERSIINKC